MKKQITLEDRGWLIKNRPYKPWDTINEDPYWGARNAGTNTELSFCIQDILDAKTKRTEMYYISAYGLQKQSLTEIAGILDIEVTEKTPGWKITKSVLQKIR